MFVNCRKFCVRIGSFFAGFNAKSPKFFRSRLRRSQMKMVFCSASAPSLDAFWLPCMFHKFWVHTGRFFFVFFFHALYLTLFKVFQLAIRRTQPSRSFFWWGYTLKKCNFLYVIILHFDFVYDCAFRVHYWGIILGLRSKVFKTFCSRLRRSQTTNSFWTECAPKAFNF